MNPFRLLFVSETLFQFPGQQIQEFHLRWDHLPSPARRCASQAFRWPPVFRTGRTAGTTSALVVNGPARATRAHVPGVWSGSQQRRFWERGVSSGPAEPVELRGNLLDS